MNARCFALVTAVAALTPAALAQPDLTISDLFSITRMADDPATGIIAFGIGTVSCNLGTQPVPWLANTSDHPIRTQNAYRVIDGRLEHMGQAWVVHGFCALSQSSCGTCVPTNCASLGAGCSSPNSAGLNAGQVGMGPKFEINASTGEFPFPFSMQGIGQTSVDKRLQVAASDLTEQGAQFFVTSHTISAADVAAGTNLNNEAYREASLLPGPSLKLESTTISRFYAIEAWQAFAHRNGDIVQADRSDVPGDGRFIAGVNVRENEDGTWRYEYAVQNYNSHRSGRSFTVPLPQGVNITDPFFNDVDYHSGEPFDGADWVFGIGNTRFGWFGESFAENANANALRWDTTYSFGFTADAPPAPGTVSVELFRGDGASVDFTLPVPAGTTATADMDGNGVVNSTDFFMFTEEFFTGSLEADITGDGLVDSADFFDYLALFFGT